MFQIEGGNKEIIQHGKNGFFISDLNEKSIASDIIKLYLLEANNPGTISKKYLNNSMRKFYEDILVSSVDISIIIVTYNHRLLDWMS